MIDFAKPSIIKISPAGDHMPADATGHAAVLYQDFGVMFAVGHGIDGSMDFDTATKRCAELQHAGANDWILAHDVRLQLLTIDFGRTGPAADPELYPDAESAWYWTAHGCVWATEPDKAPRAFWQVNGGLGLVTFDDRFNDGFVRPCRLVSRPGQ